MPSLALEVAAATLRPACSERACSAQLRSCSLTCSAFQSACQRRTLTHTHAMQSCVVYSVSLSELACVLLAVGVGRSLRRVAFERLRPPPIFLK